MQANRRRDTEPELALRKELHRRGLRYRVDVAVLKSNPRRRADIAFTKAKVVIFVDGCFWHGCPLHGTTSVTNPEFWSSKISANQRRDADTNQQLRDSGWTVLRFWEHEQPTEAADQVEAVVRGSTRGAEMRNVAYT
jgi:DNA mismatch endonuclease, patch repair protein